jgi:poly-gamma-glutamate synthesis protein (capsule biosynthesis protein)
VVVSVHSHEPDNASEAPADFLRQFAHAAVDAGASLVVGHGPHQLRGVEIYKQGAILYSLGDFVYQSQDLNCGSQDVFDAGVDMFSLAMGVVGSNAPPPAAKANDARRWEGALAVAAFDGGALSGVRLYPIDLGADLPSERRGTPRIARPDRAERILDRLAALSKPYGTRLGRSVGVGVVEMSPQPRRARGATRRLDGMIDARMTSARSDRPRP